MTPTIRILWLAALPLALLGCSPADEDPDGDGLTNAQEEELGTDPENADTDGDLLEDGDEVNLHGTDPTKADTDGDGYLDGWEYQAGTDPKDAGSVIYSGGWPYNPDKEALGDPESAGAAPGNPTPRFQLNDQFGEVLDLYDLSGGDVPIVFTVAGLNCAECQQLALFVNGKTSTLTTNHPAAAARMACLEDAVADGTIRWVTALYSSSSGSNPTQADVETWHQLYQNDRVPVLLDDEIDVYRWFGVSDAPAIVRVDSADMIVVTGPEVEYKALLGQLCDDL